MCIKKEYKCCKGKETEDCCKARIDEAVRNRTYFLVLILGISLMIIALVIKTSENDVFVNQVSFASTITSIILSVIAIWMSITGERSTNEIKTKVSESVDKLLKTSSESEKLVTVLSDTLSGQNESYSKIKNQMESVLLEVQGVKTTIISMNDSFVGTKETETFPNDNFLFCKNIIDGIPDGGIKKALCETSIRIFQVIENKQMINQNVIYNMIDGTSTDNKLVILGIIVALKHNGFFNDTNNYVKIKKLNEQ